MSDEQASKDEVENHLPWCRSRELEKAGQFAPSKCNCSPRRGDEMSWNYRIVKIRHVTGEERWAIHEVYYDEAGNPTSWTLNPSYPAGETLEELREDAAFYALALTKPPLDGTGERLRAAEETGQEQHKQGCDANRGGACNCDDCCILNVDSPSYPPSDDEYHQCGCKACRAHLASPPIGEGERPDEGPLEPGEPEYGAGLHEERRQRAAAAWASARGAYEIRRAVGGRDLSVDERHEAAIDALLTAFQPSATSSAGADLSTLEALARWVHREIDEEACEALERNKRECGACAIILSALRHVGGEK